MRLRLAGVLVLGLVACARYVPRPVDPAAHPAAYQARRLDDPVLVAWVGRVLGREAVKRGIPKIMARTGPGANRAMLGEAIAHVKAFGGTAAEKAKLFEALAGQISSITKGGWHARSGLGTGGSHVFLGGQGEALIIDSSGAVFRGSLGNGVGLGSKIGEFAVDFAKLRPL